MGRLEKEEPSFSQGPRSPEFFYNCGWEQNALRAKTLWRKSGLGTGFYRQWIWQASRQLPLRKIMQEP